MSKQLLTIYATDATGTNKKAQMIKTYSFTTDDDDGTSIVQSEPVSNHDKLLSISSPSIDSANAEDDLSEASTKVKRRKLRRTHESEEKIENTREIRKICPWYKKIDWSKPILAMGLLIFLYITWTKRDVWIPRMLTSNARIRRSVVSKDTVTSDQLTSSSSQIPPTISTMPLQDSPLASDHKEDNIDNNEKDNDDDDQNNSERINVENSEESTISSGKTNSGHQVNIRIRRNKMSFSKEHKKKKHRHSHDLPADDELEETDDGGQAKEIKSNESIASLRNHPPKKNRREIIQNENVKIRPVVNHGIRLSTYDDIIDQLRKNLKSRTRDQDFLSTVSKKTGLNKDKLYRFIYKKDYNLLTLETFMSLLDTFNLMLLVVPN
ncbi:unnamed protein product [Rotaria magnacalcarata]|uniref:Uncharacterized protein n=1 Tax=Rotaria magnacalcarata TaxID=392030 RepID=A0A817ADX9_9BILA|nr:unnamed protein product [Rotaria magnacalcarata]CAF3845072.1 unnamed protein product [Rotaria magnacalcarata]